MHLKWPCVACVASRQVVHLHCILQTSFCPYVLVLS